MSTETRFWSKVNKSGPIPDCRPDLGPCWIWTAALSYGYGQFWLDGRTQLAHRVAYEWLVGPIPDGLEPDHLCRVRRCVNSGHLEPVTRRENILRGVGPATTIARHRARTHCPQGHPYSGANLYVHPKNGNRDCRACRRAASRRYRTKRRAS